jgi:hypothetical protein
MKFATCIFLFIYGTQCCAQISCSVPEIKFAPFHISSETKVSGNKTWLVVHVTKREHEVISDSVVTDVQACTGFSIPEKQPFKGYFIFSKRERNKGRMYILSVTGDFRVIPGGTFWPAPKDKLLFILAERDYTNLLIYDLKKMGTVLEKFNCDEFSNWYYRRGGYMGKVLAECGEEEHESEVSGIVSQVMVERFDIKTRSLSEVHVSDEDLEHAKKLLRYAKCK